MRSKPVWWAVVWAIAGCTEASPPGLDGGAEDGGVKDSGPSFARCAAGALTIDGTLEGARIEQSMTIQGRSVGGDPNVARRSAVSLAGPGTIALGAIGRSVSAVDTATGAAWLSSAQVLGSAWLCGTATISLQPDARSFKLDHVARLGVCEELPAVAGEIELCSSSAQGCEQQPAFFRTTVVDLPTPVPNGGHGSAISGGLGSISMGGVLATADGELNYYFAWKESPAALFCAEQSTVTSVAGGAQIKLQGLHRVPLCPSAGSAGGLFICSGG